MARRDPPSIGSLLYSRCCSASQCFEGSYRDVRSRRCLVVAPGEAPGGRQRSGNGLRVLAGIYFNSSLGPALAALVRPAGLMLTPAFVKRGGWRALIAPVLALAALAARYGVSVDAWAGHGTFNTALFRLIPFERTAALAIVTAVYRKDDGSQQALLDHAIWITGAFLLTTPAFAPSYLTWILPFAALRWSRFWLTLSGTSFLSYHASLEFSELKALVAIQYAIPLFEWICMRGLGAKPPSSDVASRHGTAT